MTRITVKTKGAELVSKGLESLAGDVVKISKGRIYGRMTRARARITKYPPQWSGTLPKNWYKSDKQRRKVMAMVREGLIPYRRTGRYMDAWKLESLPDGYRLTTSSNAAPWVSGDASGNNQARIHRGRWAVARDVIEEELDRLPQEIGEHLTMAARRRGL